MNRRTFFAAAAAAIGAAVLPPGAGAAKPIFTAGVDVTRRGIACSVIEQGEPGRILIVPPGWEVVGWCQHNDAGEVIARLYSLEPITSPPGHSASCRAR